MWEIVAVIVTSVLGSNGLWAFIQRKTDRNCALANHVAEIDKSIQRMTDRADRDQAVLARTRILRFDDELKNGMHHSEDYFRQIMQEDISAYNRYCKSHSDFENGYTEKAVKHIGEIYEKCRDNDSFI